MYVFCSYTTLHTHKTLIKSITYRFAQMVKVRTLTHRVSEMVNCSQQSTTNKKNSSRQQTTPHTGPPLHANARRRDGWPGAARIRCLGQWAVLGRLSVRKIGGRAIESGRNVGVFTVLALRWLKYCAN